MKKAVIIILCILFPAACYAGGVNQSKRDKGLQISQQIARLSIKGDLRIRYERRELEKVSGEETALDRMRGRFRIGGVWATSEENWEIAAGLATGGEKATGTLDNWSENEFFETGDIRLDYAYAKHILKGITFTAGQQKNLFKTSWLLWDSDIRPAGFSLQYSKEIYATFGIYDVKQYENDGDFGSLYALQVGTKRKVAEGNVSLAAAYYAFDTVFAENNRPNPDYEYQIFDLYGDARFSLGQIKLSGYVQVFQNLGADGEKGEGTLGAELKPKDENTGWVFGLSGGMNKIKAGYAYAEVGADSCVGGLKDATFGSGVSATDVKGHKLTVTYALTPHCTLDGRVFIYEALERDNQNEVSPLYHFEVNYKL